MSTTLKGHLALFFAQVIYAMNYSIAKDLMPDYMGPMSLVFFRIIGATALFWLLSLFVKTQKVERADMKRLLWLAVFGVAVNQVFFIWGLALTSPINSSIIMISNPIMVFVFTLIAFKVSLSASRILGLGLAITGALLILLYRGNFELGSETITGDLMTLINSASWAVFIVMVKPLMQKYNTVTAMKWLFLFGSVYVLPIGIPSALHTDWHAFDSYAWFALSFVVVATTFLAYLLNVYGLVGLSANTVSAYIYLQPFLASLFAILIGKDTLTPIKVISGILIILGLYFINRKTRERSA